MVSQALEAVSPTNSLIRRVRRADVVGRSRSRYDYYLWLFGLIHVKQLLLFTHFVFMVISLWLMWKVGVAEFTGLQIPGLDGFSPFDLHHKYRLDQVQEESIYVSTSPNIEKPYLYISRNVASALSYLFFFSTLMGFMALIAVRGIWQRNAISSVFRINPALFLIPLLLCVVTVGSGFLLCCVRSVRMQVHVISERQADQEVILLMFDAIRFTFVPCAIMWIIYLYYVYGCILSFLYVYHHSWEWSQLKRDFAAVSTTSWSFLDRSSSSTRQDDHSNAKSGVLGRLKAVSNSWNSIKVNDNPTLRSYTKKGEDDRSSPVSEEVNESFGSETGLENNNMSRSFCSFNITRRQLDTVHEENESQENSSGSVAASLAIRM